MNYYKYVFKLFYLNYLLGLPESQTSQWVISQVMSQSAVFRIKLGLGLELPMFFPRLNILTHDS